MSEATPPQGTGSREYPWTRPLLHIGYHKTATTWLQRWLFVPGHPQFEPLSTPAHGPDLAHAFMYSQGRPLSPFDDNAAAIGHLLRQRAEDASRWQGRIPVVSHERLSGSPHSGGLDAVAIADRLQATFPDARVLVGVREQRSFLLSSYFQYLFMGGTLDLRDYLDSGVAGRRPYFAAHYLDYVPLVEYYQRLFGRDGVLVLPYELFVARPRDFVDRIGALVGRTVEVEEAAFSSREGRRQDGVVLYYARALNRFRFSSPLNDYSRFVRPGTARRLQHLSRAVAWRLPSTVEERMKVRLQGEIDQWVGERYAESNARLASVIGIDLAELGYPVAEG